MPAYNFAQVNVLVADANWHMRKPIATILQGFGIIKIEFAVDGRKAMGKLMSFPVDWVICEYRLGHIDGVELTRRIRRAGKKFDPFIPVIMVTGHPEVNIVRAARDAGISTVIAKPLSAAILYERLILLIDRPRRFVRAPKYIGPDRRHRDYSKHPNTPKRRASDHVMEVA